MRRIGGQKKPDGCRLYNPEYRMYTCSIFPYQKQKKTEAKKIEIHDTG